VERARIILACLEGQEIQQVARELRVSLATVSKWRQRFSLWGLRGLRDRSRPYPITRDNVLLTNSVMLAATLRRRRQTVTLDL
jgi:transposase-like protein